MKDWVDLHQRRPLLQPLICGLLSTTTFGNACMSHLQRSVLTWTINACPQLCAFDVPLSSILQPPKSFFVLFWVCAKTDKGLGVFWEVGFAKRTLISWFVWTHFKQDNGVPMGVIVKLIMLCSGCHVWLLSIIEWNYMITKQEVLAMVYDFHKFKHYLLGTKFVFFNGSHGVDLLGSQIIVFRTITWWRLLFLEY